MVLTSLSLSFSIAWGCLLLRDNKTRSAWAHQCSLPLYCSSLFLVLPFVCVINFSLFLQLSMIRVIAWATCVHSRQSRLWQSFPLFSPPFSDRLCWLIIASQRQWPEWPMNWFARLYSQRRMGDDYSLCLSIIWPGCHLGLGSNFCCFHGHGRFRSQGA